MKNDNKGLYRSEFEHDNCGIGAVVNIKGKADHSIVDDALSIVENLEHRAGKDAEERPVTVSASLPRSLIGYLRSFAKPKVSRLETQENTVSECSSSRRTSLREARR